jgi:hypothetical protein
VFTRARHLSLLWASWIESIYSPSISLCCILVLFSQLFRLIKSVFLPSIFGQNCICIFHLSYPYILLRTSHSPCAYYPQNIRWREQITSLLIVECGLVSSSFLSHARIFPSLPYAKIHAIFFLLWMWAPPQAYNTLCKITVSEILISTFLHERWGCKSFLTQC